MKRNSKSNPEKNGESRLVLSKSTLKNLSVGTGIQTGEVIQSNGTDTGGRGKFSYEAC